MHIWDHNFKERVGKTVAEMRREKGLTQEQVADLSELDRNYISEIERGLKMPTLDSIFRIAHGLHVKPSVITKRIESSDLDI